VKYLLIFFFACSTYAQGPSNSKDLSRLFDESKDVSKKASYASDLAWELKDINPDLSYYYANEALKYARHSGLLKIEAYSLSDIGNYYKRKEDYKNALNYYTESLIIRNEIGKVTDIASGYNQIALLFKQQEVYDSAIVYFSKGLTTLPGNKSPDIKLKILDGYSMTLYHLGKYEQAITYLDSSFSLAESVGDSLAMAKSFQNKGVINQYLGYYGLASKYYTQSEIYYRSLNNWNGIIDIQINKAAICLINGDIEEAEILLLDAESNSTITGFNDNLSSIYIDLAKVYKGLDNLKSKTAFEKAYNYGKENRKVLTLIEAGIGLGFVEVNIGDLKYVKELIDSIDLYVNVTSPVKYRIQLYELKSQYFRKKGEYKEAFYFNDRAESLRDSLLQELGEMQDLSVLLEVTRQEKKVALEEVRRKSIEKERILLQAKNDRIIIWSLALVVIVLLLIIWGIWKRFKYKIELETIEKEKEKQEQYFDKEISRLTYQADLKFLEDSLAKEEEVRNKIGRDLHDQFASKLAVVQFSLDTILETTHLEEEKVIPFKKVIDLVEESCQDIRVIAYDLLGQERLKDSLNKSCQRLCEEVSGSGKLEITFIPIGDAYPIDTEIKKNLLATITLLIDNIIRHADAKKASLQIFYHKDSVNVALDDDGIGFEDKSENEDTGVGLENAKERIKQIEGAIEINSRINYGTSISISIPMDNEEH
jgi:signal transduction histidine kinase